MGGWLDGPYKPTKKAIVDGKSAGGVVAGKKKPKAKPTDNPPPNENPNAQQQQDPSGKKWPKGSSRFKQAHGEWDQGSDSDGAGNAGDDGDQRAPKGKKRIEQIELGIGAKLPKQLFHGAHDNIFGFGKKLPKKGPGAGGVGGQFGMR